jgi:hypothetical protein
MLGNGDPNAFLLRLNSWGIDDRGEFDNDVNRRNSSGPMRRVSDQRRRADPKKSGEDGAEGARGKESKPSRKTFAFGYM